MTMSTRNSPRTDPALYNTLRDATTEAHLRGYRCLNPQGLRIKTGIDESGQPGS
jgi:hypothetical protein